MFHELSRAYQLTEIARAILKRAYTSVSYTCSGGYICIIDPTGRDMRQEEIGAIALGKLEHHFRSTEKAATRLHKRKDQHVLSHNEVTAGGAIRLSDGVIIAFSGHTTPPDTAFCAVLAALSEWESEQKLGAILQHSEHVELFTRMLTEARSVLQGTALSA